MLQASCFLSRQLGVYLQSLGLQPFQLLLLIYSGQQCAQAGIQVLICGEPTLWIPACAGMTRCSGNDEGVAGMTRCSGNDEGVAGMTERWWKSAVMEGAGSHQRGPGYTSCLRALPALKYIASSTSGVYASVTADKPSRRSRATNSATGNSHSRLRAPYSSVTGLCCPSLRDRY